MVEEISLLIRKLLKNILLKLVMGHNKTRKLLLTRLRTKHNALILQGHIMNTTDQQEYGAPNRIYIT